MSFLLLVIVIIAPYASIDFGLIRAYTQLLIILSFSLVFGGLILLKFLKKNLRRIFLMGVFLLYFVFQSGFIPGNKTPDEDPDLYRRLTPSEQADIADPPCIILHGDRDRLAPYIESVDIQDSMLNEGNICILITGHWGGHGHLESLQHSSVGLYYLERFIYLTKN